MAIIRCVEKDASLPVCRQRCCTSRSGPDSLCITGHCSSLPDDRIWSAKDDQLIYFVDRRLPPRIELNLLTQPLCTSNPNSITARLCAVHRNYLELGRNSKREFLLEKCQRANCWFARLHVGHRTAWTLLSKTLNSISDETPTIRIRLRHSRERERVEFQACNLLRASRRTASEPNEIR